MLRFLSSRESGFENPLKFYRAETTRRVYNLSLSEDKDVERHFSGNVNALDIDLIERRYLLAGGADGFIIIYDIFNTSGQVKYTYPAVGSIALNNRHRHKFSVETVLWYPLDTGMFTSSGTDKLLKIWDTNRLKPADEYQFSGIVFNHHMSPVATRHCLIAVACQSSSVKLVDLKSGSSTHSLKGHNKAVFSVKWSPYNEFILASAGSDNRIFLWDIRNAKGSLIEFDKYNGKRPLDAMDKETSSHSRPVTGLQFSPDGLRLVSCGADNKVRVWCTSTGRNTNLDITVPVSGLRTLQFAVSEGCTPDLIFMPNGKSLDAIDICTGKRQYSLQGHFRQVNCSYYHPDYHELYTGGSDRNILVWTPRTGTAVSYSGQTKVDKVKLEQAKILNGVVQKDCVTSSVTSLAIPPVTSSVTSLAIPPVTSNVIADSWSSDEET